MKQLYRTCTPKPVFWLVTVAFLFLNQGCYHKNKMVVPPPQQLLSHDTMVMILTDLQLAEGIVSFERLNRKNKKNLKQTYYQKVLNHYGITAEQFRRNMEYYTLKFDEMASIYDETIQRLTIVQEKIKQEEQRRKKAEEKKKEEKKRPPSPLWLTKPPVFQQEEQPIPLWIWESVRHPDTIDAQ